jgi:hypothetical protein
MLSKYITIFMNLIKPKRLTIETGEVFCYQWVGTAYIFFSLSNCDYHDESRIACVIFRDLNTGLQVVYCSYRKGSK